MAIICMCRSALALFLSFSVISTTCVAQASTRQFPEDQAGFPKYPTAQPRSQRSVQDVVAAAGHASLDFPPDRNDPNALQCDQLADHPSFPQRIGDGVFLEKIQIDQALSVCEQAAQRPPERPRYQFLYGRVLDAAKRTAEAAALYAAADQAGYGLASYDLGLLFSDGAPGVPKDVGQAQRLFFRAGTAGIAEAFAAGGELYLQDKQPDYFQAKSWFEQGPQGGSAQAMDDLGWLYESGNGVNRDRVRALSLFNDAAKRGSAEGMYHLGVVYHEGLGVQKDLATACQWFIHAAAENDPYAETEAGFCYYNGTGVAQDHEAAFNSFVKAGQAGLIDARVYVADMLERGDGHNQDSTYAVMWYQAAAEQGSAYAMTELGAHLRLGKGVAWNEAQAMQWFAKAAQQGYVPAETSLAMGYENGLGQSVGQGRQDYEQAARWYSLAADKDDGYAELNLGVMYEKGWGVPQNLERAKQLYARAAGNSNTAVANLGREYFDSVPASGPPERTPQRSVASSSKDSSAFWGVVVLGVLAVGAASMLSSHGSNSGNANFTVPSSPDPPKWDPDYGKNCSVQVDNWGIVDTKPVFCM